MCYQQKFSVWFVKNDNNWQEKERTEISNIYLQTNEESKWKLEQKREEEDKRKNVRHQINTTIKKQQLAREKEKNRDHEEYILTLFNEESKWNWNRREKKKTKEKM